MKRLAFTLIISLALGVVFGARQVRAAPLHSDRYQDQTVHVVQPGENLFRISLRYGTTIDAIMAANGLTDSRTIRVGQRLTIPSGSDTVPAVASTTATGGIYTVQEDDTLNRIALRHNVTVAALMGANSLSSTHGIQVGQQLDIPAGDAARSSPTDATEDNYIVRSDDSLEGIAKQFGTTAASLARLNGIANPSSIYAGQLLRLSDSAPPVPRGSNKRIVMDLSEQHLYAYEDDRLIYSFVASSGKAPSYTRVGEFRIQSKVPNAYGSTWNIWMPYWLGIYWAGSTENGIHALPILSNGQTLWAGFLGQPVSYGCIVLGSYEAKLLYHWAAIGTSVSIRY